MGDSGNYAWGSENCTKKVRILDVVYNATSNELVRTKTLLKNTIVQIDGQPFKQWCKQKYRESKQKMDPMVDEQFQSGRLLACIASRPGQSGRADGYVLEGDELQFYKRKLEKKKKN